MPLLRELPTGVAGPNVDPVEFAFIEIMEPLGFFMAREATKSEAAALCFDLTKRFFAFGQIPFAHAA